MLAERSEELQGRGEKIARFKQPQVVKIHESGKVEYRCAGGPYTTVIRAISGGQQNRTGGPTVPTPRVI